MARTKISASWRQLSFEGAAPDGRYGAAAVLSSHLNRIYYLGGLDGTSPSSPLDEVWILNLSTLRWQLIEEHATKVLEEEEDYRLGTDAPAFGGGGRAFHTAALPPARNEIVIFGGRTMGGAQTSALHGFSIDTLRWRIIKAGGTVPPPRERHAAAMLHSDSMAVYGGWAKDGWLSDLYILDIEKSIWRQVEVAGGVPMSLAEHSLTVVDWRAIAAGGSGADGQPLGLQVWDTLEGTWTVVMPERSDGDIEKFLSNRNHPHARGFIPSMHDMCVFGKNILICAGGVGGGAWEAPEARMYTSGLKGWSLPKLTEIDIHVTDSERKPAPRAGHCLCCLDSTTAIMLGGWNGARTFGCNDTWLVNIGDASSSGGMMNTLEPAPVWRNHKSTAAVAHLNPALLFGATREGRLEEEKLRQELVVEIIGALQGRIEVHRDKVLAARTSCDLRTSWLEQQQRALTKEMEDLEDLLKDVSEKEGAEREEIAKLNEINSKAVPAALSNETKLKNDMKMKELLDKVEEYIS